MDLLTISLGRNILKRGSREYERMHGYAQHLDSFHIVVLTRKEHGYTEVIRDKNVCIYPTNSASRGMMLVDAFRLSGNIVQNMQSNVRIISAQDPLEIGWLSYLISMIHSLQFHVQVHGDYFSGEGWVGHSWARRIRRFAGLLLLKSTPCIRVVSERIKNSLIQRGVHAEKITVLPIRPEIESFLEITHTFRELPPYTFLYVGRLAPEKNILRIIQAFALHSKKYAESTLRIVGDGEEKKKIETLICSLKIEHRVSLVPWTENVPKEMSNADVFLLASLHEAYALTLVEAMATGIPVITTDVGCVGEVVKDGVHGIVVFKNDVESYVSAMERMVVDTEFRKNCGIEGKRVAQTLANVSADEYLKAWVTALNS